MFSQQFSSTRRNRRVFASSSAPPPGVSQAWHDVPQRPKFSDPDVFFRGASWQCPSLFNYYQLEFGSKSISSLLLPPDQRPVLPDLLVPQDAFQLDMEGMKYNATLRIERRKITAMYEVGLTTLVAKLRGPPATAVTTIVRSNDPPLTKFNAVLALLNDTYNQDSDTTYLELYRILDCCPFVETHEEAELFISLITETAIDLATLGPQRELSETVKRTFCVQKLGTLFYPLVDRMEGAGGAEEPMTFDQICQALTKMQELSRIRNTSFVKSLSPLATRPHSLLPPDDMSSLGASNSLVNQATSGRACKNCASLDHLIRVCTQMCTLCKNPERPHHPMDCPDFIRRPPVRQASRPSPSKKISRDLYRPTADQHQAGQKRKSINEVYGYLFDDQEEEEEEAEEFNDDADPGTWTADLSHEDIRDSSVNMVKAVSLPSWSVSFLHAHDVISEFFSQRINDPLPRLVTLSLVKLAASAAASAGVRAKVGVLSSLRLAHARAQRVVQVPLRPGMFVGISVGGTTWSRYTKPHHIVSPEVPHTWMNSIMWEALARRQAGNRRYRKVRRSLRVAIHRLRRDLAPPCPAAAPLHRRRVYRTARVYDSRPYLNACAHYRSSVRGRGRLYVAPWWSVPTSRAPTPSLLIPRDPDQDCDVETVVSAPLSDIHAGKSLSSLVYCATCPPRPTRAPFMPSRLAAPPARCNQVIASHSPEALNLSQGMVDTGANLSISHPHLAVMLGVTPINWPRPIPITFGNSSDCMSTQYIHLGELLGNIALVESATSTIITKQSLHQCGISIIFRSDHVCRLVQDSTEAVLFQTKLNRPDDFFMIPLQALLPPLYSTRLTEYLEQMPAIAGPSTRPFSPVIAVNGRRALPTVTAAEIESVMSLHRRMYHPSSAVMAQALRAGAWLGVDISPTLVERVFSHRDCLFCALGKMKRVPRAIGSSIAPHFGQEVSVDYLPLSTPAKGGFTGAYVLVERAAGYAWAYLTPTHNSAWLLKAVSHVRTCLLRYRHILRVIRTDAGRVEASQALATRLAELHIAVNSAAPAAQYQNFVERFIQTAVRGIATTMVAQSFLDNSFWGMALLAWIRAWNCRPNVSSDPFSPAFRLTGRHPDVSVQFRHPFGDPVVSRILPVKKVKGEEKFKFKPAGELGFVVGNTESTNGASLIFFPNKGHHVAFPRVDIQPMHITSAALSELELSKHLKALLITPDSITLPVRPLSPSPLLPAPSKDLEPAVLDESAIAFSELSNATAVQAHVDPHADMPTTPVEDPTEEVDADMPVQKGDEPSVQEGVPSVQEGAPSVQEGAVPIGKEGDSSSQDTGDSFPSVDPVSSDGPPLQTLALAPVSAPSCPQPRPLHSHLPPHQPTMTPPL